MSKQFYIYIYLYITIRFSVGTVSMSDVDPKLVLLKENTKH